MGRSRWLRGMAVFAALSAFAACSGGLQHKTIEMQPIGTVKPERRTPVDTDNDSGVTTPNSGTPNPMKESACTFAETDNLEEAFKACDVPMPKGGEVPSVRDKLEVKVATASPTTTPGGRVDLIVTIKNKSSDPVPLFATGDPNPHFDVEGFDAKGNKRVDLPTGKAPPYPKGVAAPTREVRAYRVTLDKGGSARLKVSWDAVKTKWAPEKAKTWEGKGFPRVPAGPLPAGKYTLRVVLPMLGDIDFPRATIDVTP